MSSKPTNMSASIPATDESRVGGERLILPIGRKSPALERHYTVQEIAKLWGFSRTTVTRYFEDEPGVLKHGKPPSRKRRSYVTLRIPESVLIRVHTRLKL